MRAIDSPAGGTDMMRPMVNSMGLEGVTSNVPMGRMGATVTGVDPATANIAAARSTSRRTSSSGSGA